MRRGTTSDDEDDAKIEIPQIRFDSRSYGPGSAPVATAESDFIANHFSWKYQENFLMSQRPLPKRQQDTGVRRNGNRDVYGIFDFGTII